MVDSGGACVGLGEFGDRYFCDWDDDEHSTAVKNATQHARKL